MANAQSASDFAVTPKVGTTGVGLDLSYNVAPSFTARLGWSGYNFNSNIDKDGVKYDGKLKMNNLNLLADWFPFESSGFRVTAGLYYNGNKFDATGRSTLSGTASGCGANCSTLSSGGETIKVQGTGTGTTTIQYGGKTYSVTDGSQYKVGSDTYTITNGEVTQASTGTKSSATDLVNGLVNNLNVGANISWPSTAPYIGIGYGRPFKPDSNWSFHFDLGAFYLGSATVNINSTCSTTGGSAQQLACNGASGYINQDAAALANTKATAQDEINKVKFWPVITLGLTYRF